MGTQNIISILGLMVAAAGVFVTTIGVFVTAFFSYMIWKTTKKLGENNEAIQKQIAKDNLEFQERLKTDNENLMLYQHRVECFMLVLNPFINFRNDNSLIAGLENKLSITSRLDEIHKDYQSLEKACFLSETLFSPMITKEIKVALGLYTTYYVSFKELAFDLSTSPSELLSEIAKQVDEFCQTNQKSSSAEEIKKCYSLFFKEKSNLQDLFEKFPNYKTHYEAQENLSAFMQNTALRENILNEIKI